MATPKKAIPPKKTKQAQKPTTKPKKNDDTKTKKKTTTNGTTAAVRSPTSKPQKKSTDQNGAKSTKTPTPKSKQNGKRVREEEVEDVKSYTFPMERVKRILKAEDSDLRITSDAVFAINKATEMFLKKFSEDGHKCCMKDRKKALAYKHLSSVVCRKKRYEFLSDFVPEKIKAMDALAKRKQAKEETS